MATSNTTSTAESAFYSTLSPERRVEAALEMAQEISDESERLYAVASSLVTQLTPQEGQDGDWVAIRLAEVMRNMLSDHGQHYRLSDCLNAMREQ